MLGALNFEIVRRQSNRSATPLSSDCVPNRLMQIKSKGITKFIRFRVIRRLMTLANRCHLMLATSILSERREQISQRIRAQRFQPSRREFKSPLNPIDKSGLDQFIRKTR